jgi:hypothetical protein
MSKNFSHIDRQVEILEQIRQAHADGVEEGIRVELYRIIKLLEDNLEYVDYEGLALGTRILRVESLIALIKGETK